MPVETYLQTHLIRHCTYQREPSATTHHAIVLACQKNKTANEERKLVARRAHFRHPIEMPRSQKQILPARGPTLIARRDSKKVSRPDHILHYSDDVQEFTTANVHGVLQELCNVVQPWKVSPATRVFGK